MKTKLLILIFTISSLFIYSQTYVPDDNFEQALIDLGYDTGALDDYVPTANIDTITSLNVSDKGIEDLTGIEDFISLTNLMCTNNALTSLDMTSNTVLQNLNCRSNALVSLNVSANSQLTVLSCYANSLTSLDVSNNTLLYDLRCNINSLTTLNVSNNTLLTTLRCWSNDLTSIDISNNIALIELGCSSNPLNTIDLSNNTNLTKFECYGCSLSTLDLSANTALSDVKCYINNLTTLDISNNTALTKLTCSNNPLISLDVSNNTALTRLVCSNNTLTLLDISANTALIDLNCGSNSLASLNIANGNNANFTYFNAMNNADLTCIQVDNVPFANTNFTNIDATASFSVNCSVSSVNEFNNNTIDVTIFPNPANDLLSIKNNSNQKIKSIVITNAIGQRVLKTKRTNTIDISNLLNALYFVEIESINGVKAIVKLIKE